MIWEVSPQDEEGAPGGRSVATPLPTPGYSSNKEGDPGGRSFAVPLPTQGYSPNMEAAGSVAFADRLSQAWRV